MDLTFETLLVEMPDPGILLVTMNRPDRLNAMNTAMMGDLRDLFTELYVNPGLANCIVLTGAGERGFCPGADLKERDGMADDVWRRQHAIVEQFIKAMHVPPNMRALPSPRSRAASCPEPPAPRTCHAPAACAGPRRSS
jgi:enoyl-CoA hydratase/carnithine racemase